MRLACLFVAACALLLAPVAAHAAKDADAPAGKTKSAQKKAAGKKKPAPAAEKTTRPTKMTRTLRPGALTVNVGHEINEDAHVTPFPSFAGHAKKAMAANRRDQLIDAEQAARAEQAVRSLVDGAVPPALARLAQRSGSLLLARGRLLSSRRAGARARPAWPLRAAARVQTILDNEDAMSSTLQPLEALPEMAAAGEKAPAPVPNPDAYGGPAFPR